MLFTQHNHKHFQLSFGLFFTFYFPQTNFVTFSATFCDNFFKFLRQHFYRNFCGKLFKQSFFNFQESNPTNFGLNFHFCFRKTWQKGVKFNQKVVVRKVLNANVPPLLVSCELRNFIFSVKDKNSCET